MDPRDSWSTEKKKWATIFFLMLKILRIKSIDQTHITTRKTVKLESFTMMNI